MLNGLKSKNKYIKNVKNPMIHDISISAHIMLWKLNHNFQAEG